MQLEEPRTHAEKPSNRVFLWVIALGSGLLAVPLSAFCGELTFAALHKEPDYPASFTSLSSSERAVARAVVRYNTRVAVEAYEQGDGRWLRAARRSTGSWPWDWPADWPADARRAGLRGAVGGGVHGRHCWARG